MRRSFSYLWLPARLSLWSRSIIQSRSISKPARMFGWWHPVLSRRSTYQTNTNTWYFHYFSNQHVIVSLLSTWVWAVWLSFFVFVDPLFSGIDLSSKKYRGRCSFQLCFQLRQFLEQNQPFPVVRPFSFVNQFMCFLCDMTAFFISI